MAHNGVMLAAVATAALLVAAPVNVTVTATGHTPPVGKRLNYSVAVKVGAKPAKALLTEQIIDPIGGVHPVTYGTTKKVIKNWRFTGVFRDFILWPASSRGVPVTWRFIVVVGTTKRIVNYKITPRG